MKPADVLLKGMVLLDIDPFKDKDELFRTMSERFEKAGIVTKAEAFYQSLLAREEEGSTVFADYSLAMPHGICDEVVKPGVGFCRVKEPFTYASGDETGEVKYVFMLAIEGGNSEARGEHLQILGQLARLMMHEEFREILETADSYETMMSEIQKLTDE